MNSRDTLPQFKNLPWLTNFLTMPIEVMEECGAKRILEIIVEKERESLVYEEKDRNKSSLFKEILSSTEHVNKTVERRSPGIAQISQACASLLLYRLVDAMAFSNGQGLTGSLVPRGEFPTLTIHGWEAFCNDWSRFVSQSGTTLYELPQDGIEPTPDITLRRWDSICQRVAKTHRNKMLMNFELAALHLSSFIKGKEYPATLSGLAEMLDINEQNLHKICTRAGTQGLQFPLHLALAVSPCALFLQTNLHKQELGRIHLIEIWQGLGGIRPQLLIDIERVLWQVLLNSARSERGVLEYLKKAFEHIDGLIGGEGVNVPDINWFDCNHEDVAMHVDSPAASGLGDSTQQDLEPNLAAVITSVRLRNSSRLLQPVTGSSRPSKRPHSPERSAASGLGDSTQQDLGPNLAAVITSVHLSNSSRPLRPVTGSSLTLKRPHSSRKIIDLTSTSQLFVDGTMYELVDLTIEEEENREKTLLQYNTSDQRVAGPPRLLYDVFGEAINYTPRFHHKKDLVLVTQLMDVVEQGFHSTGKPLHVADPAHSMFFIINHQDFDRMSHEQVQDLHSRYHLLVTGYPQEPFGFDTEGMATLVSESRVVTIQDQSVKVKDDQNVRNFEGTTTDLLNSFNSPFGKILNSLDFPLINGRDTPMSVSSDLVAFRSMACRGATKQYPTASLRWGLAATEGAFSTFHIDSDGFGTYVSCVNRNGSKWWVIAGPKDRSNLSAFASFKLAWQFFNAMGADKTVLEEAHVEAVLLRPGTRLYMRPNTPHAVLTPTASICHGAFYLSMSNLRPTCYGHLMTFTLSTLLTNTYRTTESQLLFRQMLEYCYEAYTGGSPDDAGPLETPLCHVPDVSTFDGIHDLFSLCNLVEMANILHPDMYKLDGEGLCVSERQEMIKGRALSRAIVAWVISNYDMEEMSTESFYWKYLAYQARALCYAKKFGDGKGAYAYTGIALASPVQLLIECSFEGIEKFWAEWHSFGDSKPETFAWPQTDPVKVQTRDTKLQVQLGWCKDGRNSDDIQWETESVRK